MNIAELFESDTIANLGWTLVHSVWQIAVIGVALCLLLRLANRAKPNARYTMAVAGLTLAAIAPVVTFLQISMSQRESSAQLTQREVGLGEARLEQIANGRAVGENASTISLSRSTAESFNAIRPIRAFVTRNTPVFLPYAVLIWLLGVAFFSLRLGGGLWQLHWYRHEGAKPASGMRLASFQAMCSRLGMRQTVQLIESRLVETPIAIGVLRPMIIIPASLFLQIAPQELETIIAHELIHIRRFDPLINAFQCAVETVFFYHPAVWWISRQIRLEREFAADAAVIEAFQDSHVGSHVIYARALANLEEIRLTADKQMPRYATAANGGNLMMRMQKILNVKTEASRASSAWTAGLALLLTSAVVISLLSFAPGANVNAESRASGRKVAIGFVSIPPVDRTENPPKDSDATARLLIEKLKTHKVPAVGFVQGGMISDGDKLFPVRANIVRMWRDAGFEIGIGGFKHIWFSHTPYDDYVANVEKNETVVKKILSEKNQQIRYFSYPYLNTGGNAEDRIKFEGWLKDRNYRYIPYTFDNDEWLYSFAYDDARNDNDLNTMKLVRTEFLDYMQKMVTYYEEYSQDMFQRDIAQTMVLTPSRLVADSSDELFGMFVKRGYSFVSMDEALSDEAYKTPESVVVANSGISWFKRWASKQGKRLREEPKVSEEVAKIWKRAELKNKK